MTCTASGTAALGQYTNTASATGTPPGGLPDVNDTDDSHYYGTDAQIQVEKTTNGQDADTAPGPYVPVGDPVTWTYAVTNPGNVALTSVSVVDDQGVTVTFVGGDTNTNGSLDPGETWTYTATGTAVAGQYTNTGVVTATSPLDAELTASDPSHYYGAILDLTLEKSTNGQDSDSAPGAYLPVGLAVTWAERNEAVSMVAIGDWVSQSPRCCSQAAGSSPRARRRT